MNSLELDLPETNAARMRILGISGSLRAASINSALLRAAARLAPSGVSVVPCDRLGTLPLFNADDEADPPADVEAFRAEVARADALMIASPEYAHGISGTIKNALDWLVGFAPFAGKPVAVLNASPRARHADAALRETLRTMAAVIVERASIAIPLLGRNLDDEAMASTRSVAEPVREALAALIGAVVAPHDATRAPLAIRNANPADHDALVDIWLRSVRSTHTFLTETDIQSLIPVVRETALRDLELWILHTAESESIGFIGLAGPTVEALFIAPEWMRRGGGRMLLDHARRLKGTLDVEVNEQNRQATQFYLNHGFAVVGRSELDREGKPFPLLRMREGVV